MLGHWVFFVAICTASTAIPLTGLFMTALLSEGRAEPEIKVTVQNHHCFLQQGKNTELA